MSNATNKGLKVVAVGYEVPNDTVDLQVYATKEAAEEAIKLWMIGVASEHPEIVADIREYGCRDPDTCADFFKATECSYTIKETTIL